MGINLVLPFAFGDETEYVEMTIHPDKTIEFPLYNFEHDEILAELGEEKSPVYEFYKGYSGFNRYGLMRFSRSTHSDNELAAERAKILVEAIQKQGLGGFSEKEYIEFLKNCIQNSWRYGFEPFEMLKERLSDEDYVKLLKELVADEYLTGQLSFDPADLLIEKLGEISSAADAEKQTEAGEEEFKKWLIEEIIKGIREADTHKGSYYHSNAGWLAHYLKDYIDTEDEEEFLIDETDLYFENEYDICRNIVGKEYCLWLFNTKVTCWRKIVETEILDPILFHSNTEDWEPGIMGREYLMSDTLMSVLNELDVDEPEIDDPDPPDHPSPDENGIYATIYLEKSDSDQDNAPWWIIVPYESESDAQSAAELSDAIMEKGGERESFEIYIAKKKDKPNERASKQMRREFGEHDAITENVNEGEEWDTRWPTVYDVLEKA